MTYDDAMTKAILGFRVRHDGMTPRSYIYYNFNGFRIQFVFEDGQKGSHSPWAGPYDADKEADWHVIGEEKVEAWPDFVQTNWNVDAAIDVPDEPIFCPSVWEIEPIPAPKPDTVKTGWEIFDRHKDGSNS
jgi:hypothetical protein